MDNAIKNFFKLDAIDEETGEKVQYQYWTKGTRCYSCTIVGNNPCRRAKRISAAEFQNALDDYHSA